MRTLWLALLIVLSSTLIRAQENTDSLWGVWSDAEQLDTNRSLALLSYVNAKFIYTNVDSAFYYARTYLKFLKENAVEKHMGLGQSLIAQCFLINGEVDSAKHYFSLAIPNYRKSNNKKGMAGANINIGIIYSNLGNGDSAIARYQQGIRICKEINEVGFQMNALNNMAVIYMDRGELEKAIPVFEEVIQIAGKEARGSDAHKGALVNLGYALSKLGNFKEAIDRYNECLVLVDEFGGDQVESYLYNFLGSAYENMGEEESALKYLWKSYEVSKASGEWSSMASPLGNIASMYAQNGDLVKARELHEESLELMLKSGHFAGALQPLGGLAGIDLDEGKLDSAQAKYTRGLKKSKEYKERDQEAYMLGGLGGVALKRGDYRLAIDYMEQAKAIGKELDLIDVISNASLDLSEAYSQLGQEGKALEMYKEHVALRDSIQRNDNKRAAIQQEFRYSYTKQALADSLEFAKKEALKDLELEKRDANLAKQRIGLAATGGGLLLFGLLAYSIRRGKRRSDELLHNILPEEVATELKQKGHSDAHLFADTTVLFTDFKGFTAMAETMSPQALVNDLNVCFSAFDEITSKYEIEKIKTIGDAYMAAGGLPTPSTDHAKQVILAALEMAAFVEAGKQRKIKAGEPCFEVRIGIHTGPVVAGIVGVKKFQYDIWGDTVNTASRMESSGEIGKVNVSQTTYDLLKDDPELTFTARGKVEAKGKGAMEMYFVQRAAPVGGGE